MNKTLTFFIALLICTTIHAQTVTLYSQDFGNANNLIFPSDWTTTDNGWYVDNTNISSGYDNASGQANMAIKNTSPTGIYYLTTGSIETSGYENIKVLWARRISNNFTIFSTLPTFEMSIDNGANRVNVPVTDQFENNSWALTNAGDYLSLSTTADDKPSVPFRWGVQITNNPDGTYRIDDFIVKGTVKQTGIHKPTSIGTISVFAYNNNLFIQNNDQLQTNLTLLDLQGRQLLSHTFNEGNAIVSMSQFPGGIYLV